MSDTHVRTWLDDHHAIAVAAIELARRTRRENDEAPWSDDLDALIGELETQRTAIGDVLADLGSSPSRLKDTAVWLAEKLARFKSNDRLIRYSPLSRLEELESLLMACASLGVMWRTLQRVRGEGARPGGADLDARASAMEKALDDLRGLLALAADDALAPTQAQV